MQDEEGYSNISVFSGMVPVSYFCSFSSLLNHPPQPSLELLRRINGSVVPGSQPGDIFSALLVALDTVVRGQAGKKAPAGTRIIVLSGMQSFHYFLV